MADPIDPLLARRLDAYTVPALPAGFADRLVTAALAEPPQLPSLRRPLARRWLRGGVTGLGAIAVGMISISAAAMGYFGEPIRNAVQTAPVIGTVIERVLPRKVHAAKKLAPARPVAPSAPATNAAPVPEAPLVEAQPAARLTPQERRERRRAIMADPEARRAWIEAHPEAAQRIAQRREEMARRRTEMRRRRAEAGFAPVMGPEDRARLTPEQRFELRHERMDRLRERRLRLREMRGE
jgi:type IV secretory pathway VirB10-like protein